MRIAVVAALSVLSVRCISTPVRASAFRVERQEDLIGGTSALGQVGDYSLRNGNVRVIIQDVGFSRGFGVYGGSLIDADLRRGADVGNAKGGVGNDRFAEMFPVFFLQALSPRKIEITNDGSDGKPAKIEVRGEGGSFLSNVDLLNTVALGQGQLAYTVEYSLGPNDRAVKVKSTLKNISQDTRPLKVSFGGINISVPFGHVALFGTSNKVFVPGSAGFDLRFVLPEAVREKPIGLPALPGIVTDLIATKGDGVSYGVFSEPNGENNFAYRNRGVYGPDANEGSLEIPFFFSSFIGYYYGVGPDLLEPNQSFSFTEYFAIGKGDVADIRDIYNSVRKVTVGTIAGRVRDEQTLRGLPGASVIVYDEDGRIFNQHTTDENGDFKGTLPPGHYSYEVVTNQNPVTHLELFDVVEGKTTNIQPFVVSSAFLNVQIRDGIGRPLPAKVTVVGTHEFTGEANPDPRSFLFNLARGERRRAVDQIPDTEDPATRRYVEGQFWTADGIVGERVRPGEYTVYVSRGVEYEVQSQDVTLESGKTVSLDFTLEQSVPTPGYVSGDMHLHSTNSIDSGESVATRVIGCAAEGLDFAVATDHNFVTDYTPYVEDHGLKQWIVPIVGLEMTTLELGHFNGYPLKYDLKSSNRGSFQWYGRKAQDIFDDLRKLGKYGPSETVVQVNHPRDNLLGYFEQLNVDADTMDRPKPQPKSTFDSSIDAVRFENLSLDFDALEIFNGKRWELLRTVRVPDVLPPPPYEIPDPVPGAILRYGSGEIAYPGAVDDWFKLLNRGYRFTGIGDSDSHGNTYEEPGTPRSYVYVGKDDPYEIRDIDITRGIKAKNVIVTNGPFVELFVNDVPTGGDTSGTKLDVAVRVKKPDWIKVEYLTIYINGEAVRRHSLRDVGVDTIRDSFTVTKDSWVVAEVVGNQKSLFPIVTGWEEPPLTLRDAVAGIAGPLGLTFDSLGNLQPSMPRPVYPYAITNPVWVDANEDGDWVAPGNAAPAARSSAARDAAPPSKIPPPDDVRALFKLFGGHHH